MLKLLIDMTGCQIGWLTVVRRSGSIEYYGSRAPAWLCRCICGNYQRFDGRTLRNGSTQDCGCRAALLKRTPMAVAILIGEAINKGIDLDDDKIDRKRIRADYRSRRQGALDSQREDRRAKNGRLDSTAISAQARLTRSIWERRKAMIAEKTEEIRAQVEDFLAKTGMAPTTFGVAALKAGSFVRELRAGRSPRAATIAKLGQFMREAEERQRAQDEMALAAIRRAEYVQVGLLGEPFGLPAGVSPETFHRLVERGLLVGGGDGLIGNQHQTYRPI